MFWKATGYLVLMSFLALPRYAIHSIAYLMCYPKHKFIYLAPATLDRKAGIKLS